MQFKWQSSDIHEKCGENLDAGRSTLWLPTMLCFQALWLWLVICGAPEVLESECTYMFGSCPQKDLGLVVG